MNLVPGKSTFSEAEHIELRAETEKVKTFEKLTEAEIARQAEVSPSTLNSYLKGRYQGDNNSPAAALHRWLQSRRKVAELRQRLPVAPTFQPLETSRKITSTLQYAREMGRMVVIAGAPGMSKTATCRQFASETPRVWMATLDPASRGVPTALCEILASMGEPDARGTPQTLSRKIGAKAAEAKGLIIIDEAQHASDQTIEQVRSINDRYRVGIALVGNEEAYTKVGTAGTRKAFAQVSSRMAMRKVFGAPLPADVTAMANAWADANRETLTEPEFKFLRTIAAKPGGLRNVEMTMEAALLAACGADQPLQLEHLQGAFAQLAGHDQSNAFRAA